MKVYPMKDSKYDYNLILELNEERYKNARARETMMLMSSQESFVEIVEEPTGNPIGYMIWSFMKESWYFDIISRNNNFTGFDVEDTLNADNILHSPYRDEMNYMFLYDIFIKEEHRNVLTENMLLVKLERVSKVYSVRHICTYSNKTFFNRVVNDKWKDNFWSVRPHKDGIFYIIKVG